jgi:hypothetical protein
MTNVDDLDAAAADRLAECSPADSREDFLRLFQAAIEIARTFSEDDFTEVDVEVLLPELESIGLVSRDGLGRLELTAEAKRVLDRRPSFGQRHLRAERPDGRRCGNRARSSRRSAPGRRRGSRRTASSSGGGDPPGDDSLGERAGTADHHLDVLAGHPLGVIA